MALRPFRKEIAMTVKMTRTEPLHHGGPTSADVHPDEVENWKAHGWSVAGVAEDASGDPLESPEKKKPGRKPKSA